MSAFPENTFEALQEFRVTRASPAGNAHRGAEKSAAGGTNCRGCRARPAAENAYFIGFFAMARRLLILML
jgi:hypothetical protein